MFFLHEGDKLYLRTSDFNTALVFNELAELIKQAGGVLSDAQKNGFICNRTYLELAEQCRLKAERVEEYIKTNPTIDEAMLAKRMNYIKREREEANELEKEGARFFPAKYISFISFVLDGFYYYIQQQDYVCLPLLLEKVPVIDGNKRSRDYYSSELTTDIETETFYHTKPFEELIDARKADAKKIFDACLSAPVSEHYIERHKTRVYNRYDGGYHYEYIPEKERFETITFLQKEA